jgi:hypothetical protein
VAAAVPTVELVIVNCVEVAVTIMPVRFSDEPVVVVRPVTVTDIPGPNVLDAV